ncbi:hypothetical protein DSO57_1031771 [Entomophthora muscae]|uniref:Uncharacterized protein n=1 Tax=Entomophthora muscae TaxID=34485 RepID=A0ACC2RFC6_9FUNG|nr:hypothetical protein DSO57_1031771 [Entomophthora muscae]
MESTKIIIVGAGAVGGLFAFRFSQHPSVEVSLICRSNYEQVNSSGIQIDSEQYGEHIYRPSKVFRSIEEASKSGSIFDFIVITMKNIPELGSIADMIEPLTSKQSTIVLLQNGLGIEKPFFEKFPETPIISGVCMVAVSQFNPGKLIHKKTINLTFGSYPKAKENACKSSMNLFSDIVLKATIDFQVSTDIELTRWSKLLWNGSFSPICILAGGCDTFYIHEDSDARNLIKNTMLEIKSLAERVFGTEINYGPYSSIDEYIDSTAGVHYKPSLLLDYERKYPLELEVTLGAAIRAAREIDYHVPIITTLYSLLKLSDRKNRGVL